MPNIGVLNQFADSEVLAAAPVNANFDDIKSAVNDSALMVDVTKAIQSPQNFASGSVGAPSIYFGGESDLGFYRPAPGELAVAVGGAKIATFHAGGIRLASGKSVSFE